MKRIVFLLLSVLMLNGCSKPVKNIETPLSIDQLENDDLIVEIIEEDVEQEEVKLDDEMTIEIVPLSTPDPTKSPEIAITSKPTKEPEKVPINTPQPTKQPNVTPKPVVTVEPTVEPTPEVVPTPEATIAPTASPTSIPTPVPTPVTTPVSTPEPPKQACPGGYNPDWDCGARIDKATPIKLFSVADYGSVEAAFAACDVDGQSTTEYNGVEVRSYGCSQQTRNDYGIWGFAIYYMDVNGDVIY